jgi:hypothetical protein
MPFYENAFDEDDKRRTGLQARSHIGRAWRPDLRGEKRCHRSVGSGDPTYGARNGVTDRSGLETRPTGRETVSQIGRAWRPDLHYHSHSSRMRERNPPQEVAYASL